MNRRGKYARVPLLIGALFLLTLVPFALFRGSQAPQAEAAWWDNSWRYRKSIQVTNNATQQSNVYIALTLDTSDTTKFQDDCGDLRFTKQNGQLLPYYIVSGCGTVSTNVHVQIDTFPAGEQTLFVYYGNPSAPNGSVSNDFLMEATNYSVGGTGTEETAPGPVAYWKFDEGSGNTAFDSASYGTGNELLVDGDMEAVDTSAYTVGSNAALTKQTTNPHSGSKLLRVAHNGTDNPYAYQDTMTGGRTYRIRGFARSDGNGQPRIYTGSFDWSGNTSTDWQEFDITVTAQSFRFRLYNWGTSGYAEFDDVTVKEVVSGNQGTISGATWATEDQCVSGKCLSFDGTDDYVDYGDQDQLDFGMASFAVSTWFKSSDVNVMAINKRAGANLEGYDLLIGLGGVSGRVTGRISDGTVNIYTGASAWDVTSDGMWHHAIIVVDRETSEFRLYGDGTLKSAVSIAGLGSISNSTPFQIGARNGASFYNGLIDEVKIFPYALTEDQIKTEYNLGAAAVMGTGPTVAPPAGGTLSDSLVAHWAFDEQYGQTAHDKVGNNHGTLGADTNPGSDDPTWKPASECKVNGCLAFDGSNDYLPLGSDPSLDLNTMTISAWVYPTSDIGWHTVFQRADGWPNGYRLKISNSKKWAFSGGVSGTFALSDVDVATNTWTHVAGSWDGADNKIYVNGRLAGNFSESGTLPSTAGEIAKIGSYNGISQMFPGLIDEVKLYNTALNPEQVLQDMNAGASLAVGMGANEADEIIDGAGAPPIAEWKFDEHQGTTAYDTSGNGNDGTVNGATWKSGCQQGACLEFDGTSNVVAGNNYSLSDQITIIAWIKPRTATQPNFGDIVTKNDAFYFGAGGTTSRLRGDLRIGGAWDDLVAPSQYDLTPNTWSHAVFVYNGVEMKLYKNGQEVVSQPRSGTIDNAGQNLSIGQVAGTGWDGQIDHVKIYDYARTPAQIAYDYNRGAPVAHWRFDECEGTVAHDSSDNHNHGTINIGASGSQSTAGTCQTSGAWANGKDGKFGGSISFDGADDSVSMGNLPELNFGTGSFSFGGWMKFGDKRVVMPLSNGPSGYAVPGYRMYINSASNMYLDIMDGTHTCGTSASIASYASKWSHYLGVWDAALRKCSLYIDGKLVGSNTVASMDSTSNSYDFRIGSAGASGYLYQGQIDDVRIYNYALSPAQVRKVMNEGAALRFGP